MYGLVIYGVFLNSVSVAITEGSTVVPEKQAKDGVYIGCHNQVCLKKFENDLDVPKNATPDSCIASCKRYGFKFAALYNRTECVCSCEQNCLTQPENDNQCGLPCRGDTGKFCGGYFAASLYSILSVDTLNGQCGKNNETSPWSPGGNEKGNPIHTTITISVSVAVFLIIIIIVAVMLIYRRCRHTQEHEEQAVNVQNRNSRIANVTHYQSLNSNLQLPNLPQDNVIAAVSPGAEVKEVIYEDPDLERSSAPNAGSELNHLYLVLGQGVPSKRIPSDGCHVYNYPDAADIKVKAYDRASKVDEDGYLAAEPQLQNLQNPAVNVYYSSCIHKSQMGGQDESSY